VTTECHRGQAGQAAVAVRVQPGAHQHHADGGQVGAELGPLPGQVPTGAELGPSPGQVPTGAELGPSPGQVPTGAELGPLPGPGAYRCSLWNRLLNFSGSGALRDVLFMNSSEESLNDDAELGYV